MEINLILRRTSNNRLNDAIANRNLRWVADGAGKPKSWGFSAKCTRLGEPVAVDGGYKYQVKLRISKDGEQKPPEDTLKKQIAAVVGRITKRAESRGWSVETPAGLVGPASPPTAVGNTPNRPHAAPGPIAATVATQATQPDGAPAFVELTEQILAEHFADIYERDAHLRVIHSAVRTSHESAGKVLSHVLLYGLPGACKTRLMERYRDWYERGTNRNGSLVRLIDGTTMTKAGLENFLLELHRLKELPDVLVVDEIEKQPLPNLFCLLNIMGSGCLTKLNARTGNVRVPVRFTVVGICNDEDALKEFAKGALWSRFTQRLYCPRPSREQAVKILENTGLLMGFSPEMARQMAEAAIRFGYDDLEQRDIRTLKGHLDGRERLLSGEWQKDILTIRRSENELL